MKIKERDFSGITLMSIFVYATYALLCFHFFTMFFKDNWLVRTNIYDQYLSFSKYNGDYSKPISVSGTSTHELSFLIETTNIKMYKEPFFILLGIIKILEYIFVIIGLNCLKNVFNDLEKGNIFNSENIRRVTIINTLLLLYCVFIIRLKDYSIFILIQKFIFPNKSHWMIMGVYNNTIQYWFICSFLLLALIKAIQKGKSIKEEQDLTI